MAAELRKAEWLRSFGRRKGRPLKPQQEARYQSMLPRVKVSFNESDILDPADLFPFSPSACVMEIGFGGGEHLAGQAVAHPDRGYIGCEPFMDGVSKLLAAMEAAQLENIRIHDDDSRDLLRALKPAVLDTVYILFPDPWPKARHHKRRLINADMLDLLARVIKPGGELMIATDHAGYAEWILQHVLADERYQWTARGPEDFTNPPEGWVTTRYQEKANREGRPSCFLIFRRV